MYTYYLHSKSSFRTELQIIQQIEEIQRNEIIYDDFTNDMVDYLYCRRNINIHAVSCVLHTAVKILRKLDESIANVFQTDNEDHRKLVLMWAMRLTNIYDLLYTAMAQNPNSMFYQKEASEEFKNMLKYYDFETPDDLDAHVENMAESMQTMSKFQAVLSKAMRSSSAHVQAFSGIRWSIAYRKGSMAQVNQANFFMTAFEPEQIFRMVNLPNSRLAKLNMRFGLPKIRMDRCIQIPITETDLLKHNIEENNLDDTSTPSMIAEDFDIP